MAEIYRSFPASVERDPGLSLRGARLRAAAISFSHGRDGRWIASSRFALLAMTASSN
jgi:hypothetical protein